MKTYASTWYAIKPHSFLYSSLAFFLSANRSPIAGKKYWMQEQPIVPAKSNTSLMSWIKMASVRIVRWSVIAATSGTFVLYRFLYVSAFESSDRLP